MFLISLALILFSINITNITCFFSFRTSFNLKLPPSSVLFSQPLKQRPAWRTPQWMLAEWMNESWRPSFWCFSSRRTHLNNSWSRQHPPLGVQISFFTWNKASSQNKLPCRLLTTHLPSRDVDETWFLKHFKYLSGICYAEKTQWWQQQNGASVLLWFIFWKQLCLSRLLTLSSATLQRSPHMGTDSEDLAQRHCPLPTPTQPCPDQGSDWEAKILCFLVTQAPKPTEKWH